MLCEHASKGLLGLMGVWMSANVLCVLRTPAHTFEWPIMCLCGAYIRDGCWLVQQYVDAAVVVVVNVDGGSCTAHTHSRGRAHIYVHRLFVLGNKLGSCLDTSDGARDSERRLFFSFVAIRRAITHNQKTRTKHTCKHTKTHTT